MAAPIPVLTYEEMLDVESREDPAIVFHGTSTAYAAQIDTEGWPHQRRPFDDEDLRWVVSLSDGYPTNVGAGAFLLLNLRPRDSEWCGAYFAYELKAARQYAGATGGETVRCAFRLLRDIEPHLQREQGNTELVRLRRLKSIWEKLIFDSLPVIYAVQVEDSWFPGLKAKTAGSWRYQKEEWGGIHSKDGNFCAQADIPARAILGKAILDTSLIESLP